jgi:DNA-binding LacI/PurR family transcriptional regulator
MLLEMITGGEPPEAGATMHPTRLVVRTSTAAPRE